MLLETKNIKENDIIIYSRNSMDANYNYRIIFVNDPQKHHRVINYNQVKKLISEHFSKNLIAYRIVSNFPDITISNIAHGITILLNNERELIFTDPVFAVKTIEEYLEQYPSIEFRFRVQKVGYTTLNAVNKENNFREEFSFDMSIEDVVNQNDEKIADVLLKKRAGSKKKKKLKSQEERNLVFTPEKNFKGKYIPLPQSNIKTKKITDPKYLSRRMDRLDEGEIGYGGKILKLGALKRNRDAKKQIELSSTQERRIFIKDFQVETISRNDQQSLRISERLDNDGRQDKETNELGLNYSENNVAEKDQFKKIQGAAPIVIRKIGLDEDEPNIISSLSHESENKNEMFSGFLNNLQSESLSKSKKHKKEKETDLIYLFKRLQENENDSNNDNNYNS
jgi:hypothetical protein